MRRGHTACYRLNAMSCDLAPELHRHLIRRKAWLQNGLGGASCLRQDIGQNHSLETISRVVPTCHPTQSVHFNSDQPVIDGLAASCGFGGDPATSAPNVLFGGMPLEQAF